MKEKILEYIELVSIFILIAITYFSELSNKYFFLGIVIIWLVIQFIKRKEHFISFFIKPNALMYSIYLCILSLIIFLITGYDKNVINSITTFSRICFSAILGIYYIKASETKILKEIFVVSFCFLTITCIITVIRININPEISRVLATNGDLRDNFKYFGIGSYEFIYALVFIVISLIGAIKNNWRDYNKFNIILALFILLFIYTIYKAQFAISYLLLIAGFFMIILKINNSKRLAIAISIILILGIFLLNPIGRMFKYLSEKSDKEFIKMRFEEISTVLMTGNIEETVDIKARLDVYMKSINVFKDNIWLGVGGDETNKQGGHSLILDGLARYGIIGFSPTLIMIVILGASIHKNINITKGKKDFFVNIVLFFILIIMNPGFFILLFYEMFTLTPIISYLLNSRNEEKEIEEVNNEDSMGS